MTNRKNIAILVGNALEYYDFMLYGFFAAILAPLFFPHDNPAVSLIASMGSYGVGFLARPLGGAVFGHFGDKWGRKNTLSFSLLFLAIPTLGIALLPTYSAIGLWAPILLVGLRFTQGFCLGGETSGAMTFLIENTPQDQKDKASAWLVISCYVGTLVGTLLGAFFTLSFMPEWGWRLTFVIGSMIAVVGYYVRRKLNESPEFLKTQEIGAVLKVPFKSIFKTEKVHLLQASSVAAAVVVPFFIIFIYLNGLLVKDLGWEASSILLLNSGLMVYWILGLSVVGYLAHRYGRKFIMSIGLWGMGLCSYPLFVLIGDTPTFEAILGSQLILSLFSMAYACPTSAFLVDLFPVDRRYSGIAVGYSLGHAIFGGLTPLALSILAHYLDMNAAPALFIMLTCLLGYWGIYGTSLGFRERITGKDKPALNQIEVKV